ncbi:MAG: extracellular solute-binding protein [Chloroflexi bacterium]|nr:extracellular solute-binding protein [Chloroflexota bacterium]
MVFQSGGAASTKEPILKAFNAKYPGVKASFVSASSAVIPQIIAEQKAGRLSIDVSWSEPISALQLVERGIVLQYDWAKLGVNPDDIMVDGHYIIATDQPATWVYNTQLVSGSDVPRTWEDVLGPKWRGQKISVRAIGNALGGKFPEWKENPQKVVDFLNRLREQKLIPGATYSDALNRVASGEAPIGIVTMFDAITAIERGAPLAFSPISPAVAPPLVVYILNGAPHPNAAKLFVSFLNSPGGREVVFQAGYARATPGAPGKMSKELAEKKIEFMRIKTKDDLDKFVTFVNIVNDALAFTPK